MKGTNIGFESGGQWHATSPRQFRKQPDAIPTCWALEEMAERNMAGIGKNFYKVVQRRPVPQQPTSLIDRIRRYFGELMQ